MVMTNQIGALD